MFWLDISISSNVFYFQTPNNRYSYYFAVRHHPVPTIKFGFSGWNIEALLETGEGII